SAVGARPTAQAPAPATHWVWMGTLGGGGICEAQAAKPSIAQAVMAERAVVLSMGSTWKTGEAPASCPRRVAVVKASRPRPPATRRAGRRLHAAPTPPPQGAAP